MQAVLVDDTKILDNLLSLSRIQLGTHKSRHRTRTLPALNQPLLPQPRGTNCTASTSASTSTSTSTSTNTYAGFDWSAAHIVKDGRAEVSGAVPFDHYTIAPPLAYRGLFWRLNVVCLLVGAARPDAAGLHLWDKVPSVRQLMVLVISGRYDPEPLDGALVESDDGNNNNSNSNSSSATNTTTCNKASEYSPADERASDPCQDGGSGECDIALYETSARALVCNGVPLLTTHTGVFLRSRAGVAGDLGVGGVRLCTVAQALLGLERHIWDYLFDPSSLRRSTSSDMGKLCTR